MSERPIDIIIYLANQLEQALGSKRYLAEQRDNLERQLEDEQVELRKLAESWQQQYDMAVEQRDAEIRELRQQLEDDFPWAEHAEKLADDMGGLLQELRELAQSAVPVTVHRGSGATHRSWEQWNVNRVPLLAIIDKYDPEVSDER